MFLFGGSTETNLTSSLFRLLAELISLQLFDWGNWIFAGSWLKTDLRSLWPPEVPRSCLYVISTWVSPTYPITPSSLWWVSGLSLIRQSFIHCNIMISIVPSLSYGIAYLQDWQTITFTIFNWLETSHRFHLHSRGGDYTKSWTQEGRCPWNFPGRNTGVGSH